jgi:radical SAM superfamily enzyme YgiQ (UPF0313 family)
MAHIVLINPKFEISFWGLEHALPLIGKRANMPVAALPLIAALTPDYHSVTIIDENVEPIDYDLCARADIVGVTGMIVQRKRIREILSELRRRGVFTVVGGPWVSVNEAWYENLADVLFVGEAEETWPQFLSQWEQGRHACRYEQAGKTDMTKVPPPRLELLKMERYAFGSVQFSRGCPFTCDFCDIIVIFGRRPRLKTSAQIMVELEALRKCKVEIVFIVDDNLIGNKQAMKQVLRDVVAWQKAQGFPLTFVTEASLDLADDAELMALMAEANIGAVFVGIESPNEDSLKEAGKLQNIRRGATMVEKVRRIQEAGMEVWAGMIVGFDNDDVRIFEAQRRFLTEARISTAMVGMLSAIPKTPLHERLRSAGRLDEAEDPRHGTNVLPLLMSRDELSDGYVRLMADLYEPQAYFGRVDDLYLSARVTIDHAWQAHARAHPWVRARRDAVLWFQSLALFVRLLIKIPEPALRRIYRRRFLAFLRARPEPQVLRIYALKCAIHWHMHVLVRSLSNRVGPLVNSY